MVLHPRALLLSLLGIASVPLTATVLVPAEFREIVNGSEIIAFGRVVQTTAQFSDDRQHVDTLVTLEVGTYLKGGPGPTVVVQGAGRTGRALSPLHGRRAALRGG